MRISDWSSDVCSSDLKRQEDVSQVRDALIFGQAFASGGGASANPNAAVAALSDDAEICGCNGISKAKVVACIDGGATTLDAIRATFKASASCGSCTGDRKSTRLNSSH